jgi:hypothetical protein
MLAIVTNLYLTNNIWHSPEVWDSYEEVVICLRGILK